MPEMDTLLYFAKELKNLSRPGKSGEPKKITVVFHFDDALAEKLTYLIEHPEIWPEMGRAGRAHVEANYNIDKLNDRLVGIYQNLLYG
jgi:glycosyltransferase involved in cell wall biosynthesis